MRHMLVIVVGLGLGVWSPSVATAQSTDLAALAAHVQALQATIAAQTGQIAAQAGQIAALQTAMGTVTVPSHDYAGARYEGTAEQNTGLGDETLTSITTGEENTASGAYALWNTTGSSNTGVGYEAGNDNRTGSGNVFFGYQTRPGRTRST